MGAHIMVVDILRFIKLVQDEVDESVLSALEAALDNVPVDTRVETSIEVHELLLYRHISDTTKHLLRSLLKQIAFTHCRQLQHTIQRPPS